MASGDLWLLLKIVAREYSQPIQSHHDMQTKLDSWTEEGGSYLIQEDVTAVHQYFDIHRSRNRLPEKRLMLAVLQDALFCFQRYFRARSSRRRKLFFESWQWFNNEVFNCDCGDYAYIGKKGGRYENKELIGVVLIVCFFHRMRDYPERRQ